MSRVIFVTGFKGGVGKTTVSANVASALCAMGNRVVIVDADFGMRCMDLVLATESNVLFDCADVLMGRCSSDAAIIPVENVDGLFFMPAPVSPPPIPIPQRAYKQLFSALRNEYDYVIIDSCAEATPYYMAFASEADDAIIVTLHQSTSVRAAEKTASRLTGIGYKNLRLVINCYRANLVSKGVLPDIQEIICRSNVRLLGIVPYSEELSPEQELGYLSFTGSPTKKVRPYEAAFWNIAYRITGKSVPLFDKVARPQKPSVYFEELNED